MIVTNLREVVLLLLQQLQLIILIRKLLQISPRLMIKEVMDGVCQAMPEKKMVKNEINYG